MKKLHPEQWFLLLFVPLSLFMMIALPILRAPDEPAHLAHIYTIATGQWAEAMQEHQVQIPAALGQIRNAGDITHERVMQMLMDEPDNTMLTVGVNSAAAIYPPVSYLPQALGMRLVMLFSDQPVLCWYGARLGNWICVILLLYFAIRMMPYGKYLMLVFALLPLNLQQMISASADGITTALVYLLVAFVLHAVCSKPRFSLRERLLIAFLCVGLACWKISYFPMVLLLALIPQQCFGSRRSKMVTVSGAVILPAVLIILWAGLCYLTLFRTPVDGVTAQTMQGLGAMRQQPLAFFQRLYASLVSSGLAYIARIFSYTNSLSWFNVDAGVILPTVSLLLTSGVFWADDFHSIPFRHRCMLAALIVACTLLLFLVLHVWYTPVEHYRIEGFQARYLLPLLVPAAIAFHPGKKRIVAKGLPWLVAGSVLADLGITCFVLISTLA